MVPAPLDVKTTSGEEADVGSGLRAQLVKVLDVVAQADGAAERAGAGKWLICEVFRGYLLVQGRLAGRLGSGGERRLILARSNAETRRIMAGCRPNAGWPPRRRLRLAKVVLQLAHRRFNRSRVAAAVF